MRCGNEMTIMLSTGKSRALMNCLFDTHILLKIIASLQVQAAKVHISKSFNSKQYREVSAVRAKYESR